MRRSIIRLTAAAASAVVLGACTSSSHTPGGTTTTSTSAPAVTTTTAAVATSTTVGSASADPHALLLRLSDLPASVWKAQAHPADPNRRADDATLDNCLGNPTIDNNESAAYFSDFARSDNLAFASSEVDVVKSTAYASRDFAALRGPKSLACIVSAAQAIFTRQNKTSANKFAAGTASIISAPAPLLAIRLNVTLTLANGTKEPVVNDTYYLQKGNIEAQCGFFEIGGADPTTETTTMTNLLERTQA